MMVGHAAPSRHTYWSDSNFAVGSGTGTGFCDDTSRRIAIADFILHLMIIPELTALVEQLLIRSFFHNLPLFHHHHFVRPDDGGKTVRDRNYGTPFRQLFEGCLDQAFRDGIECAG